MSEPRCPGQDMRYWKPEDIAMASCPACGQQVEFWKDEPTCICPGCKRELRNPKVNPGCGGHCSHHDECQGSSGSTEQSSGGSQPPQP